MKKITKSQLKAIKLQINDANSGNIFLEGFKMLDSIKERQDISYGVITSDAINDLEKNLLIKNLLNKADIYLITSDELKYLSRLRNPEGLLLAIKKPEFSLDRFFKEGSFGVLLDSIQDPGNLGTIIRNCYAFGVDALFLYGEHCSPYNLKCIRASAGTVLNMPVFTSKDFNMNDLLSSSFRVYSAEKTKDSIPIHKLHISRRMIIVFGNEGHGISRELSSLSEKSFFIPISKKLDSINLASSVAIILFFCRNKAVNLEIV